MIARLVAVALASVMTGTPVVATICQATCATRETASALTAGEHHTCHHAPSSDTRPAITGGTHTCGHSDEGPNAIDQTLQTVAARAMIVIPFALTLPEGVAASVHSIYVGASPPDLLSLATQLRV